MRARRAEARRDLAVLALAAGLASLVLYVLFADDRTDFAQAGLGSDAASVYASFMGRKVHCATPWDEPSCLQLSPTGNNVLWLGASQLHVIMRASDGDETAARLLAAKAAESGYSLMSYSIGNANLHELRLMFETALRKAPLKLLVLGLVYDDFKDEDMHPGFLKVLEDKLLLERLHATPSGGETLALLQSLRNRLESANPAQPITRAVSTSPEPISPQQRLEGAITGWLSRHSTLWKLRDAARGHMRIALVRMHDWMMALRYTLRNVEPPRSYVQIPAAVFERNWNAFLDLAASAQAAHVKLLVYIAPRPRQMFFPYRPEDYARFKESVAGAVSSRGGVFLNLEDALSDDSVWGTIYDGKGGQAKDIFHFDARGHALFHNALHAELQRALRP
jgi:hypothetical protein